MSKCLANLRAIIAACSNDDCSVCDAAKTAIAHIEAQEAEILKLRSALVLVERRLRAHPDDTAQDDSRDKRLAYMIVSAALSPVLIEDGK